jgi:hypothetical protein
MEVSMEINLRLVKKGTRESREELLQQARASEQLAIEHKAVLAESGWPEENTREMSEAIATVDASKGLRIESVSGSRTATKNEHTAVSEAKTFLRKLRFALPMALRDAPVDFDRTVFHSGQRLGRSTPKITEHLRRIRPGVAKLDASLKPYFKNQSAVEKLDEIKTALETSDALQESKLAALPVQTQKLYQTQGRLLELIEDLNRVGKIAFDGNALMVARFNKDILLRSRTQKRSSKEHKAVEGKVEV